MFLSLTLKVAEVQGGDGKVVTLTLQYCRVQGLNPASFTDDPMGR